MNTWSGLFFDTGKTRRWNDIDQSVMSDIKQPFGYIKSTVRCSVTGVSCNSIHNHNDYCCATSRNENSFKWLVAQWNSKRERKRRERRRAYRKTTTTTKTSNMRFVTLLRLHCAAIKPKRSGQLELDEEHASEGEQHSVERQWVKSDNEKKWKKNSVRKMSGVRHTKYNDELRKRKIPYKFLVLFHCVLAAGVRVSVFVSLHYFLLVLIVVVVVAIVFVCGVTPFQCGSTFKSTTEKHYAQRTTSDASPEPTYFLR